MDINDLKSNWQNAGSESVSEKNFKIMTKANTHPVLKKIRIKLIIEIALLTILLFVYYDGFDGNEKPFYINALLITSIILYITNNLFGYFFIKNPVKAENIRFSVQKQINVLRRMSVFSLLSSSVYAFTLLLFFSVTIDFTMKKYLILTGMIMGFFIIFYFSYQNWKKRVDHFSSLLSEFEDIA